MNSQTIAQAASRSWTMASGMRVRVQRRAGLTATSRLRLPEAVTGDPFAEDHLPCVV